jgi:hypothetical protein
VQKVPTFYTIVDKIKKPLQQLRKNLIIFRKYLILFSYISKMFLIKLVVKQVQTFQLTGKNNIWFACLNIYFY